MCGIAGIVHAQSPPQRPGAAARLASLMAGCLAHRGPDDEGVWESADGTVALSHRRLSIIDLSPLGHNPMAWDNGRLWITFNGEIYNYRELRRELEACGHQFRSQTDTEVILAAYDQWGTAAVERLAGMFAFAIWDTGERRLWIARDRLGKKPLYYAASHGSLRFASELKSLLAGESVPTALNHEAVGLYLQFGYVPSPHAIYASVSKLAPGHFLTWQEGNLDVRRYWDPVAHALQVTPRDAVAAEAELESRLATAVRQRMIADVPLGGFLSGGIDSSLIVALMQEQSETPIQTFTIRFDNPAFDEADHAAAVARHLKTDHHEQTCDAHMLLGVVDSLSDMFDEPFADSSAVPTYLVSKTAREHVTVALSGDGGDELFFGYPRYRFHASPVLRLPRPIRRLAAAGAAHLPTRRLRRIADVLHSDDDDMYGRFVSWWRPDEVEMLTGARPSSPLLYADALRRSDALARDDRPGLLDLVSYLPEDILTKVDRASMAVSLEVRAPLLDHRVVELALGLPHDLKRRGNATKWLLRQMLFKRVPRELIERPKMGFGVPLADWFRGPLRERMNSYVAGSDLEDMGIRPEPVRALWRAFLTGRNHRTDLLWQMFSLIAWSRRFRTSDTTQAQQVSA